MNEPVNFLKHALTLAAKRKGFCAPNPAVGAVVVKHGKILAEGWHQQAGAPHAEVMALDQLDAAAEGASLYVTLEPCCHYGKTPPCVELIIKLKLKAVYFAVQDPNPQVCGQGRAQLIKAGIVCEQVSVVEIEHFYQSYLYWSQYQQPWVTLKMAISEDAKIAGVNGQRMQLTGVECQQLTHQGRAHSDAILTTVNTIKMDDPHMNVRLNDATYAKPLYILDSNLSIPKEATVFNTAKAVVLFHAKQASQTQKKYFASQGVRCVLVENDKNGLDLSAVLQRIGRDGIHDVWVEAGARCFNAFYAQRLIHRLLLYIAPLKLGDHAMSLLATSFTGNGQAVAIHSYQLGKDAIFELNHINDCQLIDIL